MKNILLTLIFLFALAGVSFAVDYTKIDCAAKTYDGQSIIGLLVPSGASDLLNDEAMMIYTTGWSGNDAGMIYVKAENSKIVDFRCGYSSVYTVEIHIPKAVVDKIESSSDPVKTFKEEKQKGTIKIQAHNAFATIKMFFFELALFFK